MKFEPNEIAEVVFNGNWQLKISPSCREWYIEVIDESKCNSFLEKAILKESSSVWMGNKGIFFEWNSGFLLEVIAQLCILKPIGYEQCLAFK